MNMEKATRSELKEARDILKKKTRRSAQGFFAAEGLKLIRDIAAKGNVLEKLFICESHLTDPGIKGFFDKFPTHIFRIVSKDRFSRLSPLKSSQGILGIFAMPMGNEISLEPRKGKLFILLENIQDPGNLGNIIRTATAFACDGLLITGETVDIYNPKVVRASSGAVVDLPVQQVDHDTLAAICAKGFCLQSASVRPGKGEGLFKTKKPCIIAFGNEGSGLSETILGMSDREFTIPISQAVESLNVSVAVAIAVWQMRGDVGNGQ